MIVLPIAATVASGIGSIAAKEPWTVLMMWAATGALWLAWGFG